MQEPTSSGPPSLGHPARFRLSARGHATEAAYRSTIVGARGSTGRPAFERARSEWALCHGLRPDDGAYLGELRLCSMTTTELGEALTISDQSREVVSTTIHRLVTLGFVEELSTGDSPRAGPDLARAQRELTAAQLELDAVNRQLERDSTGDRQMITATLRQAISRVLVARRFLATLADPI